MPNTSAPITGPNAIVLENEKPGTPEDVWQVAPGADSTLIQGFTTAISTNLGGEVDFKINNQTSNANYHIDIYRLGYYGGGGATLVTSIQHQGTTAIAQPAALTDPATGLVDAGNWQVTDSWSVPTTATSGVYVANVIDGAEVFQIPFVVRNDSSTSDIVFQTSDETWQAYNGWGGANLYGGNGPAPTGAAYAVSYNRPITTQDGSGTGSGPQDTVFGAEYAAIQWMEENGYDVSYIAGLDTATNGSLLLNHKIFMDAGHDEYWTDSQVANVVAAKNAGVNLTFLSGNEIFWQTQFDPSISGDGAAGRTLVTYKDSHFQTLVNPTGSGTGTFEAPVSWGGANTPSNALTGTVFQVDQTTLGTITIPYDLTQLRFWRNTSVASTAPGQTASLEPGLLGYEWDSSPNNGFMPTGLIDLSSTTVQTAAYNSQFGNVDGPGTATHNLVEYRDPTSGALVFGAGTVFWSWGLSSDHTPGPTGNVTTTDPNVQQAMVNLFADMGVQPGTLQASLVIASQSTDHTAPTSKISSISASSVVEGGQVTVTGTATDVGGVIGGVQVSTDGGKTWNPASGQVGTQSVSWTYTFNAPAPGTYSIETRAVDDSLNLEAPGPGTSYVVTPSSALSLFGPSDSPAVPSVSDTSVEVGVKFSTATGGKITGLRFYKGSLNVGAHTADLWSSTGTLLATATFTNESASGWQQVNFSNPVTITPGTTYVASYHTNGNYSDTTGYFDTYNGQAHGSLAAPGDALNGVFAYGAGSIFPNNISSTGDNFWVDVVFSDTPQPQANADSGFTVNENGTLSIAASALLANDTDPNGLALSITGVSIPTNGTVSYNASTQSVTFVPNTDYSGAASFTYSITDANGGSSSASVGLVVNGATTTESLFSPSSVPSIVTVADINPIELGLKFQADTNGEITGIRFYKGPQNTGTHVADLWSSTGTLLATATFASQTASGWQEVDFSNPVAITAGTTYVASYHTNGDYSADPNYFATSHASGDLIAPSGSNGVYAYGSGSLFPTNSFNSTSYGVDVVFTTSAASAATSTLVASPGAVTADGVATTTLTVTVENAQGNIIPGAVVSLSGSGAGNNFGTISGTTNASGVFTTTLASTLAQTETITATEGSVHETTSVTFSPGAASAATSTLVASPGAVTADGVATTTLTVTVEDAQGNIIPGAAVSLSGSGSGNTFGTISGTTNASGVFTTTLASTLAQTETITAT